MMLRTKQLSLPGVILALGLAACSAPKPEPEIASAAPQGSYAVVYPQALTQTATGFSEKQSEVRKILGEFSGYPDKLKDPGWGHVREIVASADHAGKSYAYVERARKVQGAADFFTAERDEISRKVAGSAQYVAKNKGCDVDVSGAVVSSLKESVDKQLEKELRDGNEAQHLVERYRAALGKENALALEQQADAVSRASYLVHVALVEDKLQIQRMLNEAEEIRRTSDQFIKAERDFQAERKTTPAEKKASETRIEEMNKSKGALDAAIQQGNALLPKLEEQIQAIRKEYDDALLALLAKIDERAKSDMK